MQLQGLQYLQRATTQGAASCSGRHVASSHAALPRWCGQRTLARDAVRCLAKLTSKQAKTALKTAVQPGVDPVYLAGANYLRSIGFTSTAEVARVLDIAMNPYSLFDKKGNANARPLDVESDMVPVVEFLRTKGLTTPDIVAVITAHPPVLCYSVEQRLAPFWDYLDTEVGLPSVAATVVRRPSLMGLSVEESLRKIVGYLVSVETPPEKIMHYLETSI